MILEAQFRQDIVDLFDSIVDTWAGADVSWVEAYFTWEGHQITTYKVYLGFAPENITLPYIVLNRISGPRGYTLDGADGTSLSRVQVDVYADNYADCKTFASELYVLHNSDNNSFKALEIDNEFDEYDDTLKTFRVSIDFLIYEEE